MAKSRIPRREFLGRAARTSVTVTALSGAGVLTAVGQARSNVSAGAPRHSSLDSQAQQMLPASTTVADLHRAVHATVASGRIGKPVFVRYTMQSLEEAKLITARLAQITALIREWVDQPLENIYAVGAMDIGQVSLTLQFHGGASALVSFASCQPRGNGVDLMVLGNHGAAYYDAGTAKLWDEDPGKLAGSVDTTFREAIERALKTGKPVKIR